MCDFLITYACIHNDNCCHSLIFWKKLDKLCPINTYSDLLETKEPFVSWRGSYWSIGDNRRLFCLIHYWWLLYQWCNMYLLHLLWSDLVLDIVCRAQLWSLIAILVRKNNSYVGLQVKTFISCSYTGTGSHHDVGFGKGKYYSVNVPLKDGISDKPFIEVFSRLVSTIQPPFLLIRPPFRYNCCTKLAKETIFFPLARGSKERLHLLTQSK